MGAPTFATKSIITRGLSLGKALKGNLTARRWYLYIDDEDDLIRNLPAGGGPYPGIAWNKTGNIQNFYRVMLDDESDWFKRNVIVAVRGNIQGQEVEKILAIDNRYKKAKIRVLNLINVGDGLYATGEDRFKRVDVTATMGGESRVEKQVVTVKSKPIAVTTDSPINTTHGKFKTEVLNIKRVGSKAKISVNNLRVR